MRTGLFAILLFTAIAGFAQEKDRLVAKMQALHRMMVKEPYHFTMDLYVHDSLSYGHSNGWIENRKEFRENMINGKIVYHSFREDSISVVQEGNTCYIRFIGDIEATLDGKRAAYHLKVLEVWVRKNKSWKLFARQAVKG